MLTASEQLSADDRAELIASKHLEDWQQGHHRPPTISEDYVAAQIRAAERAAAETMREAAAGEVWEEAAQDP